jgi:hypothetical protein
MEAEFRQKTTDLRLQFQRDSDVVRVKQREPEREISKWADRTTQTIATEAQIAQADQIKAEAARKEAKIKAKEMVLRRRKLEDLRLEHNRANREIEKLQYRESKNEELPKQQTLDDFPRICSSRLTVVSPQECPAFEDEAVTMPRNPINGLHELLFLLWLFIE